MNTESISICIPRVSVTIDKQYIKTIFQKIVGPHPKIQVIPIPIKNEERFKKVFININCLASAAGASAAGAGASAAGASAAGTAKANNLCNRLANDQTVKIVYDEPHYWRCSLSTTKPYFNK